MSDAADLREGIVRLPLPGGRAVSLQLTFAVLDAHGHDWFITQFRALQKGKKASATARAELLEALTNGAIMAEEVSRAPVAAYPMADTMKALWRAWELAQYGPDGRSAEEAPENPRTRRATWWGRFFSRR